MRIPSQLVWVSCVALAMLPAASSAQIEELRRLQAEFDPLPDHPPFEDPVTADSPNAAGRYIWLSRQVDLRSLDSGWVEMDFTRWRLPADVAENPDDYYTPDIEAFRLWLNDHRDWTDSLVEASRLERFERYTHPNPRVDRWSRDDPRHGLTGNFRRFMRILKDDCIRLWIDGDREAAIDRAEAIIRVGLHASSPNDNLLDGLVAASIQRHGFELIEHIGTLDLTQNERQRLIQVCLLVPSDDPSSLRAIWARTHKAQRAFVKEQLQTEGGGEALWIQMGLILGIEFAVTQMFQPLLDALDPQGEQKELPEDWPAGAFSLTEAIKAANEQFRDLTHDDLVAAYEQSCEYGDDFLERWDKDHNEFLIKYADAFIDDDRTCIGTLVLATAPNLVDESPRTIAARNSAIAVLCGADPAP